MCLTTQCFSSFPDIQLPSVFSMKFYTLLLFYMLPSHSALFHHPFKLISYLTLKSGHKYFLLDNKSNHSKHQMVNSKCYRMIISIALSLLNLLCSTSSKNINFHLIGNCSIHILIRCPNELFNFIANRKEILHAIYWLCTICTALC